MESTQNFNTKPKNTFADCNNHDTFINVVHLLDILEKNLKCNENGYFYITQDCYQQLGEMVSKDRITNPQIYFYSNNNGQYLFNYPHKVGEGSISTYSRKYIKTENLSELQKRMNEMIKDEIKDTENFDNTKTKY
jgi:hypothetical protein